MGKRTDEKYIGLALDNWPVVVQILKGTGSFFSSLWPFKTRKQRDFEAWQKKKNEES